jgi:hypothetical protein
MLYQLAKARKVRMTHIVNDVINEYLKGLGDNLIEIEKIKKQFVELGLNYDEELSKLRQNVVPRIIVKDNGFYIHYDKSYLDQDTPVEGDTFECIVMEEQFIRALDNQFTCYSIDSKPMVSKPRSHCRDNCAQTKCVVKIRLWLWAWDKPLIMVMPPDVMINWQQHKLKLFNSNLPMIAANTVFNLVEGNIVVDIRGSANKEALVRAVQARSELRKLMDEVSEEDFL